MYCLICLILTPERVPLCTSLGVKNTQLTCLKITETKVVGKPLECLYKFGTERVYTAITTRLIRVVFLFSNKIA